MAFVAQKYRNIWKQSRHKALPRDWSMWYHVTIQATVCRLRKWRHFSK